MNGNHPGDLDAFVDTLRSLGRHPRREVRTLFDPKVAVTVARAPGRLDVMGGIADYSGSLVLQRPIAEATFAALQPVDDPVLRIVSLGQEPVAQPRVFSMNLSLLAPAGEPIPYNDARDFFQTAQENHWAAYVAGSFLVLMRERGVRFSRGARILISSAIPQGKGVASSAALEVAVMNAVASAFDLSLEAHDLALLCQRVENMVAGAPCGVMDQMTSVFGKAESLLSLLCQPAQLQPALPVPPEITFWGLDSGETHSVGGASYEAVRAGAFMGFRIIASDGDHWDGYLANVTPADFDRDFVHRLPEEMSGEEFVARYSATSDAITRVIPARTYKIRRPTAHPVYEHHRVKAFRDLMLGPRGPSGEEQWTSLGELMYESHASYSACGLGSRGTDTIVEFVRAEGPAMGLYGARITGGGCGGTVAILGRADAGPAVERVVRRYQNITGYNPFVFSGTSNGASSVGTLSLNL
jgi:galactokinase